MTSMRFAERARQVRASRASVIEGAGEESESSERRSAPMASPAVYELLDAEIARDVAAKYPRAEIVARLARLDEAAQAPAATNLDRVLAADWRAVLAAKDAKGWGAASP